ncbi:MAG: MarR family transcriptional regulator [Flavobacteriales bacterium]|nr:MarR family transcriptional regulator [Flavobacteriales bacterium]MBV6485212.1 HTH-type transcriptional regulator MhqR [Flavobacteriales bacterium]MBX2959264.1 MarR family transcriptional regulator [Flavobacteriales bacterium]MCL4857392.1 MarR family transcriptional regulator [Flavobacteriales bacterium]
MKIEEAIKQKKFKSEYQKLYINIIYTANWLNNESIKTLKPFGISPQQYNVLRILNGQYPNAISVNNIIDRMLDKNSNASRLVDKLKQKELVEREICSNDRRQVDIKITEKGIQLLDEIAEKMDSFINIRSSLTENEAAITNEILDKLRN